MAAAPPVDRCEVTVNRIPTDGPESDGTFTWDSDGFSCREQIAQETDRRALHLADVLRMALRRGLHGPAGDYPEQAAIERYEDEVAINSRTAALLLGGAAAAAATALAYWNRRSTSADR